MCLFVSERCGRKTKWCRNAEQRERKRAAGLGDGALCGGEKRSLKKEGRKGRRGGGEIEHESVFNVSFSFI